MHSVKRGFLRADMVSMDLAQLSPATGGGPGARFASPKRPYAPLVICSASKARRDTVRVTRGPTDVRSDFLGDGDLDTCPMKPCEPHSSPAERRSWGPF